MSAATTHDVKPVEVDVPEDFLDRDPGEQIAAMMDRNRGVELRAAINDIIGISSDDLSSTNYAMFRKEELALVLLGLAGAREVQR